jgi:hypothetical protein
MLRIDGIPEVQAAALLWSRAPEEIRKGIKAESAKMAPVLRQAMQQQAGDRVTSILAATADVGVTSKGLIARAGSRGKVGRTPARELVRQYEFGSPRRTTATTKYMRRNRTSGGGHYVTRHTHMQLPSRNPDGRFAYPAVARVAPELVARWVRVVAEAATYG